ncbi:MAG: response regulator [Chloroflexota bacterium]
MVIDENDRQAYIDIPCVLLVDDEQNVLNSLRRTLRKEPYEIITAASGEEALALLEKSPNQVSVVVSDFKMPEMDGITLLRQIRDRNDGIIRIMLSGYADAAMVQDAINEGQVFKFISKPWNEDELKALLRSAVQEAESLKESMSILGQLDTMRREMESADLFYTEPEADATTQIVEPPAVATDDLQAASIWREIVEATPVAIIGVDAQGSVVFVNPYVEQLLGVSRWSILGVPVEEALPSELAVSILDAMKFDEPSSRVLQLFEKPAKVEYVPLSRIDGRDPRGTLVFVFPSDGR